VDIKVDGRGDRALEALLVLAFLDDLMRTPATSGPDPALDPADELALEALGPHFVERLLEEDAA
jgi:hypothetical protein